MKKLFVLLLSLVMMLSMTVNVSAASKAVVNTPEEFYAAASSKDVTYIELNSDLSLENTDQRFVDLSGKTLDLKGKTLKSRHFKVVFDGTDFTIKNGTIASLNNSDYPLFIGERVTDNAVIENVKVEGGINVYNTKKVTLRNSEAYAKKKYYAIWADVGANIVIESGKYTTAPGSENSLLGASSNSLGMTINGGTFIAGDAPNLVLPGSKAPVLNAGTFDKNPMSFVTETASAAKIDDNYYVGTPFSLKAPLENAKKTVEVLQGLKDVSVPQGVEVSNNSGENIVVNGDSVENGNAVVAPEKPTTPSASETPQTTPEKDKNVKTGDDTNLMLPVALVVLSLIAMATVVATRRRHN